MSVCGLKINSVKMQKIKQEPLNIICYIQIMKSLGYVSSTVLSQVVFEGSVLSINVTETILRKSLLEIFIIQMFLHKIFITWVFSTVIFIIIPSVTKVSNSLSIILNIAKLTRKKVY